MTKPNVILAAQVPGTLDEVMTWTPNPEQRKTAIITNYLRGAEAYLIVGKLLTEAHKQEDWKKDGTEAQNFFEWVEKELTIKRANADRMIQIWRGVGPLLPKHQDLIRKIDFTKLAMIIPIIRLLKFDIDEQKILEWLHMAETNTVKDLENNIREKGGGQRKLKPTDTCMHDNMSKKLFCKCKLCGAFFPETQQRIEKFVEVLETAKKAIYALHGDLAWDTYNEQSPEMKAINQMLKELGSSQY